MGHWQDGAVLAVVGLLCSGCAERQNSSPSPAQAEVQPAAAAAPTAPARPVESDSGLALKRGLIIAISDGATFTPCGDSQSLWVLDQGEESLQTLLRELHSPLYIEAYGERAAVADDTPAAKSYAGVFVLEQVLYAAPSQESRGCKSEAPDYVVAARGNEPFWAAEVSDSQMTWRRPDQQAPLVLAAPEVEGAEGAVRYRASHDGQQLELLIEGASCRDSMSGEYFAFTARAKLNQTEFNGCARVGK